jgi:glycosyltransferase involved in cell wall biosynthesis
MPAVLSVVVPVYDVEDYLHQCLDSIRAGLTPGEREQLEIIAVDDASPDRCGALLDAYAREHDGLHVLHLRENVGLGPARNAGLGVATGEWVWFVDSDDWLPPGSVSAVLAELRAKHPDVLLVDHLRSYEDGRQKPDKSSPLLAGEPTRERMLRVQHTAWNRIVRREFMLRNDLLFQPGWYEDVSFSHPVLLAADTIAALNRVCYHYRVGRPGAITATRSHRHFEAFDHYDHVFAWMAEHRIAPELRSLVFTLTISHLLVVVGTESRMHSSHRRRFFGQIAALYRRHRPAGYAPPPGMRGVKVRLAGSDSYLLYSLLRASYRLARPLRRKAASTPAASPAVTATPRTDPTSSMP